MALCVTHHPQLAIIADPALEAELRDDWPPPCDCDIASGHAAIATAAAGALCDVVVAAIVGAAGLDSTLAAARAGKRLLLANKEAIVMAGPLLLDAVRIGGGALLPVDSEHNAIFQCLPPGRPHGDRSGPCSSGCAADPHRLRRPVPWPDPRATGHGHARPGVQASELGDGPQDFRRLRHADEQGPGSYRGAPSVRRCRSTPSMWWCTRRAWCIRSSNTSMARCWRNSGSRHAHRDRRALAWPRTRRIRRGIAGHLATGRHWTFEAPDLRPFAAWIAGLAALRAGGDGPGRTQCRQRDRGGSLPGRRAAFLSIADVVETGTGGTAGASRGRCRRCFVNAMRTAREVARRILRNACRYSARHPLRIAVLDDSVFRLRILVAGHAGRAGDVP